MPSTATISCFSAIVIPANQAEPVGRRAGKNSKAGGGGVRELVRGNLGPTLVRSSEVVLVSISKRNLGDMFHVCARPV